LTAEKANMAAELSTLKSEVISIANDVSSNSRGLSNLDFFTSR
jgi:hypothetical protein